MDILIRDYHMSYVTLSIEMNSVEMTPIELVNHLKRIIVSDPKIYPGKVDEYVAFDTDVNVEVMEHSGPCEMKFCGRQPVEMKRPKEIHEPQE